MQLFGMMSDTKYRVYFNEIESNNIRKALGNDVSIRNIKLCYFIERILPKMFDECIGKRIMVANIYSEDEYINAVVILQNIQIKFNKPKEKNYLFKATEISFEDIDSFNYWISNKKYIYKIIKQNSKQVKVVVFNVTTQDELLLSLSGGQINKVCNILEYVLLVAANKFREQISAFT